MSEEQLKFDCIEFQPDTEKLKCLNDSWTFKEQQSNPDDDKKVTMFIPNVNFMAKRSELNFYLSEEGKPPKDAKSMSGDQNFKYVGLLIPCLNTGPEFNDKHQVVPTEEVINILQTYDAGKGDDLLYFSDLEDFSDEQLLALIAKYDERKEYQTPNASDLLNAFGLHAKFVYGKRIIDIKDDDDFKQRLRKGL